jgi:pimeloyl-ACP methyl ester carboxylesterase
MEPKVTNAGRNKSTIVRLIPRWVQLVSRAAFAALERCAPGLGARLALRMWLTPPHARARAIPQAALPPGERFAVPLRQGAASGTRSPSVAAETWGAGPVVYLLHGWGGERSQLMALVPPLLDAGMQVVALDAPGHGESRPGRHGARRTTFTEIAEALTAVAAITGPAHAVISHSGGCTATALAVREGLAAQRLVFVAPMADPMRMLRVFAGLLGLGPRTEQRFRQRLERIAERSLAEFDLPMQAAKSDKPPPLLVIHDQHDREVPSSHGRAIAAAWPGAELELTTGLGHRRLLADPQVIRMVVAFVSRDGT